MTCGDCCCSPFGVVSALGIYADLTGPVGRFLRDVAGLLFGWGRLALPVAIAGVGLALLQGRPRQEPARVVIGTTFMVLSVTGLIHLFNGTPTWTDPAEELRAAGGLVGVAMAEPLRGLLAVPGAALILARARASSGCSCCCGSRRATRGVTVARGLKQSRRRAERFGAPPRGGDDDRRRRAHRRHAPSPGDADAAPLLEAVAAAGRRGRTRRAARAGDHRVGAGHDRAGGRRPAGDRPRARASRRASGACRRWRCSSARRPSRSTGA